MAYLYRLIAFLALMFVGGGAFSSILPVASYEYQQTSAYGVAWFPSASAAAAASVGKTGIYAGCTGSQLYPYDVVSVDEPLHKFTHRWSECGGYIYTSSSNVVSLSRRTVNACPPNSTGTTTCTCNTGYVENSTHTGCDDLQTAACNLLDGQTTYAISSGTFSPGGTSCGEMGCNVTWGNTLIRVTDKTTGVTTTQGDAIITSSPCTFSAASGASQTQCQGQSGTVNGVTVCVPYDPALNVIETTQKTDQVTSATGPNGAASSASSAVSVTSCTGTGSCTTTTTTTGTVNGSPVNSSETKTESQTDFCKTNPTAVQCKSSSNFSGSCGVAPACTGDAVECAIAAATFSTNCSLNPAPSSESSLYDAAKSLTGELPRTQIALDGSIDQTELLGQASGASDLNVTIAGVQTTLSFSVVNVWLERLGFVLQALAFLLAIRIVGRGY